jgi:hypothetical protein
MPSPLAFFLSPTKGSGTLLPLRSSLLYGMTEVSRRQAKVSNLEDFVGLFGLMPRSRPTIAGWSSGK